MSDTNFVPKIERIKKYPNKYGKEMRSDDARVEGDEKDNKDS